MSGLNLRVNHENDGVEFERRGVREFNSNAIAEAIIGKIPKLRPDEIVVLLNAKPDSGAEARHVAGQYVMDDPRGAQALALFNQLDERGKTTSLAMLAVAVKLHPLAPKEKA